MITRPQDDPRRAPGLRADLLLVDLLLVDGDPCADITATRTRTAIWPTAPGCTASRMLLAEQLGLIPLVNA